MSDRADRAALPWQWPPVINLQLVLLGGMGLAAGIAALALTGREGAFVLSAISGGCLGAALLLAGRAARRARREARALDSAVAAIRDDPAPVVLTDADGLILSLNTVAEARTGGQAGAHVSHAFSSLLPNASSVVARQAAALYERDSAHETVLTPRGPVRLVVSRVEGGILWRLDETREPHEAGEGIGLPMMVVSHADTILSTNGAMRELLGAPARDLAEVFPEQPLVPGRRTRMNAGGKTVEVVPVILTARDGRREIYAVPGLAEPPAASVAARAFESLPVASLHIAADGQVLASNRQAQVLLGIGPQEGGYLSSMVEGLGRPVREWVADTVAERIPTRSEVVRARRRSDECFLQIALSRITDASGPSILAVLHDATELKSLEQQFVQSQKMQAVGELAGGVAHDFNNLLTAITGHCDLLLLPPRPGRSGLRRSCPDQPERQTVPRRWWGQLLAFSRQQKLKLEIVDLRDTMADLLHLLNRLVGERIKLTLDHDPGLLPIRVDRRQFDQVIMNLVVNARDAMAEGGEVRVETRVVHLREPLRRDSAEVPAGNYVTVSVKDQGHGIPAAKLARIFEARSSPPRTWARAPASACRWPMASSSSRAATSSWTARRTWDRSSRSTSRFMTNRPSRPGRSPPRTRLRPWRSGPGLRTGRPHPKAPCRNPLRRDPRGRASSCWWRMRRPCGPSLRAALQLRGYTVVEAGNAEAALETLRQSDTRFDLFVTDVVMPGMDGPTWVRGGAARASRCEGRLRLRLFGGGYR